MAFDLNTARPVKRGFDLSTAKPVTEPSYAETALGVVTDIPSTISNIPRSAAELAGGIYEAVTSPIETITTAADIGAGGIRNAAAMAEENGLLPQGSVAFLDSLGDPQAAEDASAKARAFGGVIADRWGSADKIRRTLREDPVGFLADVSTILTGVGGAVRGAGLAGAGGKVGTIAAAVDPLALAGKGIRAAGQQINRMVVPPQVSQAARTSVNFLPKIVQSLETTGRRAFAGAKARALADITEGQDVNALIAALEQPSQFPRTSAEAAAPTRAAEYVALQQRLAKESGSAGRKKAAITKVAIERPVANIKGTPEQRDAALKRREDMSRPFYAAADAAMLREDAALRELFGRPEVATAAAQAAKKARSEQRPTVVGETKAATTRREEAGVDENFRPIYRDVSIPGSTAEYSGKFLSDVIEELKADYKARRALPTADASSNRILKNTIDELEGWYQTKSPDRRAAKDLFEMYSKPVNRQDIGELIFDALSPTTKRGTAELNFDAFAKLLEDEPAAVKKALDWSSTTKKFKDYLSENDIKQLKAIDAERINKNLAEDLEKYGRKRASNIVSEVYDTAPTGNWLNRFMTVFNMVKRIVGAKLSDKAIAEMTLEAVNPAAAAKALREMQAKLKPAPLRQMPSTAQLPPVAQRTAKIAGAVRAGARELPRPSSAALTAAGAVTNAMTQAREENPNVFLTDAYGRSYAYPPR